MVEQELITTIKRIGVTSGVVEVFYGSSDPLIFIEFNDEDTGVHYVLDTIQLGRLCHIKETYVIGNITLNNIKTSEGEEQAGKLLLQQGEGMKKELLQKTRQYAKEINERAGIPVEVIDEIQGRPGVMTEHDQNMWHAAEVLRGIDDNY
ncbi:hypothetical protein AUO94_13660 [Planococcus kocurii]|uniref:Uncharacterized protein n=1 Tax=Planococcus kocurii TaxID=1374 RepID=A0ABM5WZ22_9BACL|nr:hypothetical protein [Planococcus kocurii]ALS79607.1 hypothetical protein AUO94_13660 [Planococcus kocurii]